MRREAVGTRLDGPELRKLRAMAGAAGTTPSAMLRTLVRSATGFELAPVKVFFQNEDGSGAKLPTARPAAARQA
jgi:hypothetical protein